MLNKNSLLLAAVFAVVIALTVGQVPPYDEDCETDQYKPDQLLKAPTYVVNLDLPPQQRWEEITKLYAKQLQNLIAYLKQFILEFSPKMQVLIDLMEKDLAPVADQLPEPYGEEIKGIANVANIPLGDVVLYNIFYEIFTLCTSIVGQDSQGNMYHARNLDFGLFLGWDLANNTWIISELLRPAIINVNFTSNGVLQYKTTTFAGFVGVITGIKPNSFSFSLNERFGINGGYIGLFEWFTNINRNQAFSTLLSRQILETPGLDFEKVVKTLANTPLLAPVYFIVGGPEAGQGAVITRDRKSAADVWRIGGNDSWYLAETNYDHWKKPLFVDDRITPANKCMQKSGQDNMGFSALFNVLSTKPVFNKLTVYTTLMEVKTGKVETYIRDCPDPCWPF